MRRITVLVLLSIFFSHVSYAGTVTLKARAWPTQITVGDEIKLSVQVDRPKNVSIKPLSPKTICDPFELKSVEVSSYTENATMVRQTFLVKLTVFKLGELQIPPIPVNFTDAKGLSSQVWTEPILVKVNSVIKKSDKKADIRPIKGPVSLDLSGLRTLIFGVLAFLLAAGLIVKVLLRRRNQKAVDLESLKPPHERALLELGRLEAGSWLAEGKVKEFYSELADILRRYLERRFQIETLESTTFEIVKRLKDKEFYSDLIAQIKGFLESSDLVKFAKFVPPRSLAGELSRVLRGIIEQTKPEEDRGDKK